MISVRFIALITCILVTLSMPVFAAQPIFKGNESIPANAIVLFDGKDTSNWVSINDGSPAKWLVKDGYMQAGGGNIRSKQEFKDFQLHVEFWLPLMANASGQGRANSGVYLQGSYEVQVLDSYGLDSKDNDCGGLYQISAPDINACRPPKQWQTYDILFHAPKFDDKGNKISNARVTVLQNGVWIHDNLELPGPTPGGIGRDNLGTPGPIMLQDHGNPVRYRNIWIRPL